jgi:hypothetical protein
MMLPHDIDDETRRLNGQLEVLEEIKRVSQPSILNVNVVNQRIENLYEAIVRRLLVHLGIDPNQVMR